MICLHKDRRLFLQQNGQSPNTNLRYAEWWEGEEFLWIVGLKVAATMIAASGEA